MGKVIKSYKGFSKDLTCRGFKYEVGETYETDGAKACERGFHACERPLDVFNYYPPADSRYHEVEQSGELSGDGEDSKIASSRIKIGAEIGIPGLVKAHIEYVKNHTTTEHTDPKKATAGSYGAATAGDSGAATAGYRGAATAGYRGAATAGSYGAATSRGSSAVGENGVAIARGNNVKVKGGKGAILVLAEEQPSSYDLKDYKVIVIDGEQFKADTWYRLINGEVKEIKDDE